MKLFKYTIIAEYDEDKKKKVIDWIANYPYGERGFEPKDIESETVFSSKEKAIQHAKIKIKEEEIIGQLLMIESIILDKDNSNSKITIINLLNEKEYQFSWVDEYRLKKALYKKGDWIYFYSNQRLQIGLISAEAEGEEPYIITTENNCLSDGHTHDHVGEMWIIKKLDYEEVKEILPYKFLSNIEVRHQLYEIKNSKK